MQQLTQKLRSGELRVQDVPCPKVGKGMVAVRNHYSIVSGGTEGSTVTAARQGFLGKARERPQQAKQVLDTLQKQGPVQTYRAVMTRIDAYSPLGYSCAGEVIELGEDVTEFQVGDLVACAGGGYANHAEIVAVPVNLSVKLKSNVNLKHAAYNTLGAIALQGVRQADLRVGETCVVIGLGLLGHLTCMILKASGVHVVGVDVSESAVEFARKLNTSDNAFTRNALGIEQNILQETSGIGADAVIIAAATRSTDPVNFAGAIARKKGTIVVLGAVPTGFDRDPHWYRKELQLKMACSYGPGRYDFDYEEKGIDYPVAYVRWTEKRNMEAFQRLIYKKQIDLEPLTTHEFEFDDAPRAFDIIVNKSEPYIGIALKYDVDKPVSRKPVHNGDTVIGSSLGKVHISFIGAGSYAQSNLLPHIPTDTGVCRVGVLSNTGTTSKRVAERYGFAFSAGNESDVLDEHTDTVFIATRHDSHASYVLKALQAGKNVFVEKPLCLTPVELDEITSLKHQSGRQLMVGFNRRFAPLSLQLKQRIGNGPMSMIYRINAGHIPSDSWIQDREIGGGRVIGESCHFIDLLTFINGSQPKSLSAMALPDPDGLMDTVNISIQFQNGSTGIVAYFANGSSQVPKEYLEVFSAGSTAILDDFRQLRVFNKGGVYKKRLMRQDKGQAEMVKRFIDGLIKSGSAPIPYDEINSVTRATFLAMDSIRHNGRLVYLDA